MTLLSAVPDDEEQPWASTSCAVCFEDGSPPVPMPCCGKAGSTVAYCRRCIEMVCTMAADEDGVGRCPSCRTHIRMSEPGEHGGEVQVVEKRGTCMMCMSENKVLGDQGMCDACVLGDRFPLRYECSGCRLIQTIPHPMWRYQATPESFGTATWACHMMCDDFTNWRVLPEDAAKVPHFDCPETWTGRREEWLASIRRRRLREQRANGAASSAPSSLRQHVRGTGEEECVVL